MRLLSVNHLRLGRSPGCIPEHLTTDGRAFSASSAWSRAVALAIRERVHAVLLSGEVLSADNDGLEPWSPLIDGLAELQQAGIPVIGVAEGQFTAANLQQSTSEDAIHWLEDLLEWDPPITTSLEPTGGPALHVIPASLAETDDAPATNPVTMEHMDHPGMIWLLTKPGQPDAVTGEHALIVEPGSCAPMNAHETGRHGAWLIDTDTMDAQIFPLANLEFASLDINIAKADNLDDLERIIVANLVQAVTAARNDGSMATALLADVTLTGSSRIYPALADTTNELQRTLDVEHDSMEIAITRMNIDATPLIDLEPLLNRPDPVGEVARLINVLSTGDQPTEAQARLLTATEQKLLAVSHARVFGSILDTAPDADAQTLLLRQSWATLDALVRQRGID